MMLLFISVMYSTTWNLDPASWTSGCWVMQKYISGGSSLQYQSLYIPRLILEADQRFFPMSFFRLHFWLTTSILSNFILLLKMTLSDNHLPHQESGCIDAWTNGIPFLMFTAGDILKQDNLGPAIWFKYRTNIAESIEVEGFLSNEILQMFHCHCCISWRVNAIIILLLMQP